MHPAKFQINLHVHAVWTEFSLGTFWITKDTQFLHVNNEDWSDSMDAQVDLRRHWAYMSEGTFSHVTAHIYTRRGLDWLQCPVTK